MSYCSNLNIAEIEKLSQEQISKKLNECEQQCNRYTQCDTVAYMNDILSYSENCPKELTQDDIITTLTNEDCAYNRASCDMSCDNSLNYPLYDAMYNREYDTFYNKE